MSSIGMGAELTAAQSNIAAIVAARKADPNYVIPMKVGTSDGKIVEIKDPAKQQEFLSRSRVQGTDAAISAMIAEGSAKGKLPMGIILAAAAGLAAFFMFK